MITRVIDHDRRIWEFRYKMQYQESRVKVVNSYDNSLLVSWNKDLLNRRRMLLRVFIEEILPMVVFASPCSLVNMAKRA
jgi:hypothetical protein